MMMTKQIASTARAATLRATGVAPVRPAVRFSSRGRVVMRSGLDDVEKENVKLNDKYELTDSDAKGGFAAGSAAGPGSEIGVRLLWEQEVINGRSAMLGFVAAVVSETITGQSTVAQMLGQRAGGDPTGPLTGFPIPQSILAFFATIAIITLATNAPRWNGNWALDSKSFGPFTPVAERWIGRVAMLGFAGLVLTEFVTKNGVFINGAGL